MKHQFQRPLNLPLPLQRVQLGESRQLRHGVIYFGIVLHGATAQGIYVLVDMMVAGRQSDVVPHDFRLGNLWQTGGLLPQQVPLQDRRGLGGRHIAPRHFMADAARH